METNIKEKDEVATVSQDENNTELAAEQEQTNRWWQIKEAADIERINYWSNQWATNTANFTYTAQRDDETSKIKINAKFNDKTLNKEQKEKIQNATICAATGSASHAYSHRSINQTINAFATSSTEPTEGASIANAVTETLLSMSPKDEIEGMLCARTLLLQDQILIYSNRALCSTDQRAIDSYVNRAVKLGRLQNETIQTLLKYRRKGDQSVVVQHQHINVANGGQAIGVHTTGGAGDNKKN